MKTGKLQGVLALLAGGLKATPSKLLGAKKSSAPETMTDAAGDGLPTEAWDGYAAKTIGRLTEQKSPAGDSYSL